MRGRLSVIFQREPWWAEWWAAWVAIGWAFVIYATPVEMTDRPSLNLLGHFWGDDVWSALAAVLGVAQVVALLVNHRWMRWGLALLASWLWCLVVVAIIWSAHYAVPVTVFPPGAVPYMGYAGISLFSVARLLRKYP